MDSDRYHSCVILIYEFRRGINVKNTVKNIRCVFEFAFKRDNFDSNDKLLAMRPFVVDNNIANNLTKED